MSSNEVPLFVSGHLLWVDRFVLLGLVVIFGVVVLGLSVINRVINGPPICAFLGLVAVCMIAIYYVLSRRRWK